MIEKICKNCKYYSPFKRRLLDPETGLLDEDGDHICGMCKLRKKLMPLFILRRLPKLFYHCRVFYDGNCEEFERAKCKK